MITEENKYRAEIFKIAGFSLMTPFGKLVLSIPDFKLEGLNFPFVVFAIITFLSFFFGIILLSRGLDMVIKEGK